MCHILEWNVVVKYDLVQDRSGCLSVSEQSTTEQTVKPFICIELYIVAWTSDCDEVIQWISPMLDE